MTSSRSSLFALLGLVLPAAAFIASPASAATSGTVHHKSRAHHASVHKAKPHATSPVHRAAHRTTRHPTHKPAAS